MTLFNTKPARLIVPGFHPDPSVCQTADGQLLAAFSSFEYDPGLPVYESRDNGKTWSFCSHAASRPSQFTSTPLGNSQGFYAPTIREHNGTVYLIVTDVNRGAMIFRTRDVHGQWNDPLFIHGWPGIDPSLFFDDDGTVYVCGNEAGGGDEKPGIYAALINPDTAEVTGPRTFLIGGITGSNPEGPHLYKRHGKNGSPDWYYLMWAEGGTEAGHMECIARASSPLGPYTPFEGNPILTNRSTHLIPQCIGHADLAGLDGFAGDPHLSALVFLGLRTNSDYPQQGWLGRESFLASLKWGDDGWPQMSDQSFEVSADDPGLAMPFANPCDAWIRPGVDRENLFTVSPVESDSDDSASAPTVRVHATALRGAGDPETDFDSQQGPRLIGRRQSAMTDVFHVKHCTVTSGVRQIGAIAYANARVWAAVRCDLTQRRVIADVDDEGLRSRLSSLPLPEDFDITKCDIALRGTTEGYDLSIDFGDGKFVFLGHVPCQIFASTHAGGFTGLLFGVFARGEGSADFDCQ
jgi:xylan 1,4-beta-xylosidase